MKRFSPGSWLKALLLLGLGTGSAVALDRFPTPGCDEPENLTLLHRCNPYAVKLIYVSTEQILPAGKKKRSFVRKLEPVPGPSYRRRLTLQQLVDRYIHYEERIQALRHRPRLNPPSPSFSKPIERPTPPETVQKEEHNATKPAPTLAETLGERNVTAMLIKPASRSIEEKLLKVNQTQATLSAPREKLPETIVHRVQAGESLIGLARRYKTSSYDLRRWNGLKRDHLLRVGEKLTIHPGVKSTPEEIREGLLRETYGYYRVKKGDTLLKLARRFGVKSAEIRRLNDLPPSAHLRVGQKLMLPLTPKKIKAVLEREKGYTFKYTGDHRFKHRMRVVATAYTSHRNQTDSTPFLAAWNNRIRPGMKIIAVSPDLIRKYGITNGTKVKISGLRGIYTVRDKMNPRLHNHIDIYMGTDRRRALRWGRRRVILYW
ncbi:LysM peptidoglycan-binding domain-containing protein [Nitratifractor salsuginis]|uniref:Peptidoglycan-binding lysin domain protein n=1 Tax=Nitratifractor salsuginis (strain DSM 16511 / JCM 12458 / E9I37-1) TaxID=749222 RepID=E6X080_NITSE|nr:LysM peptidoglycan-binding domain-containing protein [Nitratifractor salsuginis]ADV45669.1 Peptidoglycan-binding lysin domain protein [Nitratifractor salsuginis DSM 16511]